ncbi:MAG: phosphate acetyltransferase [Rhodothermaceae bacterium]|nr:phosphate acetyltransferase [Rhodothermaceae bacterium]
MDIIQQIRTHAKAAAKNIVLPETEDARTLKAAEFLLREKICKVSLIGDEDHIRGRAEAENISLEGEVTFLDFRTDPGNDALAASLHKKRAHKGMTPGLAGSILSDNSLFYAAMLVDAGRAHGCVAGAVNTTGDVLRAAIQGIGLKPSSSIVSSIFLMSTRDGRVLTFGDCAVVPYPDPEQLATIAIDSADTHRALTGQEPLVAMLSFSTMGSASHEQVDLVLQALNIAKDMRPDLNIDGELQFDAAYVPDIAIRKAPGSKVAGRANVFIFPNIDAGNIAYKITERLGGATAVGPIIQGLARPMNDLSRGCSWEDIVNTVCVTALT